MIRETMLSYSSSTTGSYSSLSGLDNVGAKTGTSNWDSTSPYVKAGKSRDLWMTAYTPDYTCSVWMGFDTTGIKKGKNTSDYKAYPAKVVAELLKYLQKIQPTKNHILSNHLVLNKFKLLREHMIVRLLIHLLVKS